MSPQNFFCHLPFTDIQTDGNTAQPCCNFSSSPIPLKNYQNNPIILDVKQKLFQGIAPSECIKCVQDEKKSGKSFRTLANEFHPYLTQEVFDHDEEYSAIRIINFVGSNICNLKCLPCEHGSYIREKELYDLGLRKNIPLVRDNKENLKNILKLDIEILTLCSGEPFYDKDSWTLLNELVQLNKSKNIRLDINTNLTHVTNEKLNFLSDNFKSVQIKGSIDGIDNVNDYLRFPSQWYIIEKNVDMILSNEKINFLIITALSNLSLIHYHKLFKWCQTKKIKDLFISQVSQPSILSCNQMPEGLIKHLVPIYQDLKQMPNLTDRSIYCLDMCLTLLENSQNIDKRALVDYLSLHDCHRGSDWKKVFPELKN